MKLFKALVALSALVSLGTADVDPWKPDYTIQVDSIPLYPAHPSDAPWTFSVPQGKSCTLAPASICCDAACHALNSTRPMHDEETVQLGGVSVAFKHRGLIPTSFGELPWVLDTYNNETGLIQDADKAAGKMFEFAVRVAEQVKPGTSQLAKGLPKDVVDAAAGAVEAVGNVIDAEGKTIPAWLYLVDQAKLSGASDMPAIAGNPSGPIRAAVNRMQWFRTMAGDLSDPGKAREIAAAVLHDLGANCGIFDHDEELGAAAIIPEGLNSFFGQTAMPGVPEFKDIETRKGDIVFNDDTSKAAASVFCDALDGNAGTKDLDKTHAYFTTLTERQNNLVLSTGFVADVVLGATGIGFSDRKPGMKNDTAKLGRRQEDIGYQHEAPAYLTRVSQRRDVPFAEQDYSFKVPPGKGVTIFVIGSGLAYNDPNVVDELRLEGDAENFYHAVQPVDALPPHVSTNDIVGGDGEDAMTGSGTPMAVLAAGRVYGVAKEASVYAVQAHWRYKRAEDEEEIESTGQWAMNEAYNHVMAVILERGLQGKAVVVVSRAQRYSMADLGLRMYRSHWIDFLKSAREEGVTVVLGSGHQHHALNEDIPDCSWMLGDMSDDAGYDFSQWINYDLFPEVIHARSAEADGSYSWFNGLHPHGGGLYVYAQGGNVECLRGDGEVWATSETNNAAAIIAGVAATYLANPDYEGYFAQNSDNIAMAVKRLLAQTSYPRRQPAQSRESVLSGFIEEASEMCSKEAVAKLVAEYPFPLPQSVPMVYNSFWGSQNGCSPLQGVSGLRKRQEDSTEDSSSGEDSSSDESSSDGDSSSEEDSSDGGSSSEEDSSDGESSPGEEDSSDEDSDDEMDLSCQDELPTPSDKYEEPEAKPEDETTGQSWEHLFCIPLPASEDLGSAVRTDDKMTPDLCGKKCCGAMYFALRAGKECMCVGGPAHLSPARTSEDCDAPCGGDESKTCGGKGSADVYVVDQIATREYCRAQREGKED